MSKQHSNVVATLSFLALAATVSIAAEVQPVEVINLPEVQRVEGAVGVNGPIPSARMERQLGVLVSPVSRTTTSRLVDAGTLRTDGFTTLVLSLAVEIKGTVTESGTVGALLVPNEPLVMEALRNDGAILFPVELAIHVEVGSNGWLTAGPATAELAFPEYRILLYNGSDKSLSANLFAYLRNS